LIFQNPHRVPRTPLLHPDEYFEKHPPEHDLARATGVVLLVAIVATAAAGVIGWTFAQALDVMVTVENPAHTPEWACENFADSGLSTPEGCGADVSATTQVNLGEQVWERFRGYLPLVFVATFAAWVVAAVLVHAATAFADGAEGPFTATLAVSGWAAAPNLLQAVVGTAVAALLTFLGGLAN
jgi:hypothetical protein